MRGPTRNQARKWANTLRSGKYPQAKGKLQTEQGYCCLGVACLLFIPEKLRRYDSNGHLSRMTPAHQEVAPKWLKYIERNLGMKQYLHSPEEPIYLITMNDQLNFSFDEIADVIELIYIHKALD